MALRQFGLIVLATILVPLGTAGADATDVQRVHCDAGKTCSHNYDVKSHYTDFEMYGYCKTNVEDVYSKPNNITCTSPNVAIACTRHEGSDVRYCRCNHQKQRTTYKVKTSVSCQDDSTTIPM